MIGIKLPYQDFEKLYTVWAHQESEIDFRNDSYKGTRCTVSFAAEELCRYLNLLGLNTAVTDDDCDFYIELSCNHGEGQDFSFSHKDNVLTINGSGRCGLLYGVYEFLESQGIRWYSPTEEFIPKNIDKLTIPECKNYSPDMPLGRGFDFEGPLKESEQLFLWMARNKLNLSSVRSNTKHFQKKLGMVFKNGGHIFEKILNPNQITADGKTMLENHPYWYGKKDDPLTADNALTVQFCVCNDGLREFLWSKLLKSLKNEWYDADRIDIWGFDVWGNTCQCEKCVSLGNGADQMLYFLSYLRNRIDMSIANGTLDHNVQLVMCAYEGTSTLEAPLNGIPSNLQSSGDYAVFYPIIRCYEHTMDDDKCSYNKFYHNQLAEWNGIPIMVGEYYNVSKFEDLPLVFMDNIPKDLAYYVNSGIKGMTYMHLPLQEWGMRTINQYLYARFCWSSSGNADEIKQKYFEDLYGSFAESAQKAYSLTQEAVKHCTSWRAWCERSVLSSFLNWSGKAEAEPLYQDDHLAGKAVEFGNTAVRLLNQALTIMRDIRSHSDIAFAENYTPVTGVPVNPTDNRFKAQRNALSERANQDIRGLIYGIDIFKLMTYFVLYAQELHCKRNTDELWRSIEELCAKTEEYCYSVKYNGTRPELNCVDTLERSGLKDLYYRCLSERQRAK